MTINKNVWKNIIQFLITVLTALGTAFGVTSCMETRSRVGGKSKKLVPFFAVFQFACLVFAKSTAFFVVRAIKFVVIAYWLHKKCLSLHCIIKNSKL